MGLGDFKQDEFTEEEKAALGEGGNNEEPGNPPAEEPPKEKPSKEEPPAGEPAPKTEPKENEPTPEEKTAAEAMGLRIDGGYIVDDDGTKIPATRWKKIYHDYQEGKRVNEETNRKLTLFKQLGADEFYKLYPDEKPADYQTKQPDKPAPAEQKPNATDVLSLVVRGGDFDGYTLGDLLGSENANERAIGAVLLDDYHRKEAAAKTEQETAQKRYQESTQREINAFEYNLAKETFGKDKDFTAEEVNQIRSITPQVIAWMRQKDPVSGRSRVGYTFQDAYFIMNRDNLIKKAKVEAANKAVEAATKPGVKSIGSGDTDVKPTGYEEMLGMTEDQFKAKIEKMPDKEFKKFLKEAPKALKDKHSSLPWE